MPNFFIAGAAKAGTTSLWRYLLQHPDVFMPNDIRYKEPAYFCDIYGMSSLEEYLSIFSSATTEKRVGEASGAYLTWPESPSRIKTLIPDAKFIISLRNPVDRAYSLYNWMAKEGYEWISDFEQALEIEKKQRYGNPTFIRSNPEYYYNYLYFHSGLYSQQIQRYYDSFGEEQVIVLLFEELKESPKNTVQKVYRFLGVDDAFAPSLDVHNRGCIPYSVPLQFFLKQHLGRYLHRFRVPGSQRVVSRLMRLNVQPGPSPEMDAKLRKTLAGQYAEDIKKTGALIKRDLMHWLKACPD